MGNLSYSTMVCCVHNRVKGHETRAKQNYIIFEKKIIKINFVVACNIH